MHSSFPRNLPSMEGRMFKLTSTSGLLSRRSLLPKLPSGGSQLSSLDDIPPLPSTNRSVTKEEVDTSAEQSPSKKDSLVDQMTPKNKPTLVSLSDRQPSLLESSLRKKLNITQLRSVKFDLEDDEDDDVVEDLPLSSDESEGLLYPFGNVMDPATLLGKKDSATLALQAKDPLLHISAQSLSPPSEPLVLDSQDVGSPIKAKQDTYSSEPLKPSAGTLSELTLSGATSKDPLTRLQQNLDTSPQASKTAEEEFRQGHSPSHLKLMESPSHLKLTENPSHLKLMESPSHPKLTESPSHPKPTESPSHPKPREEVQMEQQLQSQLEEERKAMAAKYQDLSQELNASHLKDLAELKETLLQDHQKNMAELKDKCHTEHLKELGDLENKSRIEHEEELQKVKETMLAQHHLDIKEVKKKLEDQHHKDIEEVQEKLEDQHHKDIEEVKEKLEDQHHKELTNIKETLETSHLEEINQLRENLQLLHSKALKQLEEEHQLQTSSQLQVLQTQQQSKLSQLEQEMEKEMEQKKQQTLARLEQEFQDWKLRIEQEFKTMRENEADRKQKDHLSSREELRELQESVAREQELLKELKSRRSCLQEQVDKLQQELDAGRRSLANLQAEMASVQRAVELLDSKVHPPPLASHSGPQLGPSQDFPTNSQQPTLADPPSHLHPAQTSQPSRDNTGNQHPTSGFELLMEKIDLLEKQFLSLESRLTTEDRWSTDWSSRHHQGELGFFRQQMLNLELQNYQLSRQLGGFSRLYGLPTLVDLPWHRPKSARPTPPNSAPMQGAASCNSLMKEENTSKNAFNYSAQTFEKNIHQYSSQLFNTTEKENEASDKYEQVVHFSRGGEALKEWQHQLSALYRRMQDHHHFLQSHLP